MLFSMALCHILPEADEMYGTYLKEREAAEKAELGDLELHEGEHGEEEGVHHEEGEDGEEGEHHDEEGEHGEEEGEHDDHHDEHAEHGFPFAYTLFIVGFLLMLTLDKVLFSNAEIKVVTTKNDSE